MNNSHQLSLQESRIAKVSKISGNQSRDYSIDLLRFPLAIAVIFIHMNPKTICLYTAPFSIISWAGISNVISIIISNVLASIAVPTFFVISGYLFFQTFRVWSWDEYKKKIKNRFNTLIIPYLTWNMLVFISVVLMKIKSVFTGGEQWSMILEYVRGMLVRCFYDYSKWETMGNIFGHSTYMTAPIDIPLWFLRDLIVMIFLSPLIFYLIKKCSIWAIIILINAYIANIWIEIPGFSITAFAFFSIGAYLSIKRGNLTTLSKPFICILSLLSIILFIPCVYFDGTNTVQSLILKRLFIITSVFPLFSFSNWIVGRYKIKPIPLLVNSCFFIYASHTVFILGISERIANIILPGESALIGCIHYLITPLITTTFCVSIYYIITIIIL